MAALEPIAFPDVTAAVISYLGQQYTARGMDVTVARVVPDPLPDQLVTVARAGGIRTGLVTDQARLLVEARALDDETAHDLLMTTRALIGALPGQRVGGILFYGDPGEEAGGPIDLPDPVTLRPRWTYQPVVYCRGTAI